MAKPDEKETWQTALGELEVVLSKANFTTWFKDTFIVSIGEKELILGVPNAFTKEWLENKYHPQIFETLKKIHPSVDTIKYTVASNTTQPNLFKSEPVIQTVDNSNKQEIEPNNKNTQSCANLNPKYTFENFVIGNSNRLAAATAQAITTKPGQVYNPLFLYGGVGLGKTHLVQAIGNEILKKHPKKKIIYVSCEKFTNDFIQSISNGKISEFKKNYRDADVLLVDDIQFLSGKEGTQEEFFYTFNALHQSNRQIVITSDRVPKAIPQLEERLSSRFGWGMVADIQTPNLEMRQAILKEKSEEKNFPLPDEILLYIAENMESNIRELEGAITKISSSCQLSNLEPSLDVVAKILEDVIVAKNKNLSVDKIIKAVSEVFSASPDDILSAKRNHQLVWPRQITMYLLRHEMNLSYPKIGQELNKKDHTTIIHGVTKVEREIGKNDTLQRELTIIKEKLYLT